MHFDYIPLIIITFFAALALIIIGVFRRIIKRAIKNHIIPDLNKKGFIYKGYESVGFFEDGDFTRTANRDTSSWSFFSGRGSPVNSFFFYIYYKSPSGNKRVTARIDTVFLAARKVEYSHEL
jgi:hypothetical protein